MRKLIICLFSLLWLASCKKEEDTCQLDMAGVAGTYRVTAVKYKASASASEVDYYDQFYPDPCERDDRITLNANGTYLFSDAGMQCSPPGDDNGNWALGGNTIIVDGVPSNVDSYNCSTLVVSNSGVFVAGDKLTTTLSRQ